MTMTDLDRAIRERASELRGEAVALLRAVIAVPKGYVADNPACGTSNHEGPRLELLKTRIVELGAVRSPEDVGFDAFGNLVWTVSDPDDGFEAAERRVVLMDGHSDTVKALADAWRDRLGGGLCPYDGLVDEANVDLAALKNELGKLPEDWRNAVFGRGSADQLGGVVAQVFATKIALELAPLGALKGVTLISMATVAEEDNDGGGPMYLMRDVLPNGPAGRVPDVVVLTEGTGDANKGPLGIYRGQRGRMQIEVDITGRSCHGSMPWEGRNPLEFGGAIVAEAAERYRRGDGFLHDEFLGPGSRTASWAVLDTPSDCAVPERFTLRFDRRLTAGETAEEALADIEALSTVATAREAGLDVRVSVPRYDQPTWRGYRPGNPQIYPGWVTPAAHPAVQAAVATYHAVVSRGEPARVDRWIFSTDGVGFPVPKSEATFAKEGWVESGDMVHPPMLGFGPGIEQNTHKIGECLEPYELEASIAFLARFGSRYVEELA